MSIQSFNPRFRSLIGYGCVLAATIIWSVNFIVARGFSDSIPPVALAFLRWSVAAAIILPFTIRGMARNRALIRRHLLFLSATALLGVTLFNTLVYIAARDTAALNLTLIAICSPVFVVLLARVFLRESFTFYRVVGVILASCGVIILITQGNVLRLESFVFSMGDVWMLIAAALFAGYSVLVRFKPVELGAGILLASIIVLGLVFLLPWFAWEQLSCAPWELSSNLCLAIVYLGIGPSLIAFLCWNEAIRMIGPSKTAFVYYSLPLFSGLEASLMLGEHVSYFHVVSGLLILCGIVLASRDRVTPLPRPFAHAK